MTSSRDRKRARRFLSDIDRADFVWFFTSADADLDGQRSPLDTELLQQHAAMRAPAAALRPNVYTALPRASEKTGRRSSPGAEPDPDKRTRAAARFRRVEAILERLACLPGGREHLWNLHDGYVFPEVIHPAADVPTARVAGERYELRLASGRTMLQNHFVIGQDEDPGIIPGIATRSGKAAEAFAGELEAACRAYEKAKAGKRKPRKTAIPATDTIEIQFAEAARRLGWSRAAVTKAAKAGQLRTIARGRQRFVVLRVPTEID